jgi:ADP-L-glycero-D-manno-heptose 6-epimerase
MNIITGHKGFIGSHLFNRVTNPYGIEYEDCFEFLENFNKWNEVECIYHMGAISDTTCTDVQKIYKYNIDFTIQLLRKCIDYKIPVKYASSASVYGNQINKINPLNQYALSKTIIDYWIEENKNRFCFVQGFRFFNVYGNGESHKGSQASPVTQFRKQAQTGFIKVFEGSANCIRDFICVEDVCDVILHNRQTSGIYDLGTSKPISFLDVAKLVQKNYGGEIQEIPFPKHLANRYQYYTCADQNFDFEFNTVQNWLFTNRQSSV